jgi:hypothetical protein
VRGLRSPPHVRVLLRWPRSLTCVLGVDSCVAHRSGGYAIGGSNAGSNIIWSNGRRDPWHGGGFLRESDALPGGAVFVMSATAHHQDLRAPSPNDPAELVAVRKQEEALIRKWIREYKA